jgi:DNA-directed RNA polymerase specialized sigma24 family protein
LYAIVKNLWLKQWNKNKRLVDDKNIDLKVADNSTAENSNSLDLGIVRKYLNEMGETCRQVLLMFYFDGFDMKTIAQANHFANPNVAKAKKHQCLQELAKRVKSKYSSTDFYQS